jgi:hypothetical protein
LVEENGVPRENIMALSFIGGENHWSTASHWQK